MSAGRKIRHEAQEAAAKLVLVLLAVLLAAGIAGITWLCDWLAR